MRQLQMSWMDEGMRQALTMVYVPDDVDTVTDSRVLSLVSALQACSYAHLYAVALVVHGYNEGGPTSGPFDCNDNATIQYPTAEGHGYAYRVTVPAPITGIFTRDTVDFSASQIEDLSSALIGFAVSTNGFALETPSRGWRSRYVC